MLHLKNVHADKLIINISTNGKPIRLLYRRILLRLASRVVCLRALL